MANLPSVDASPEGTNGESACAWRHVNSGRYKSEDPEAIRPLVLNQADEKDQRKDHLRKFEDSRCARSYLRCRPRESCHHPRSYSALSSLRPQQVTSPHDVSVRALIAFPRERTCVIIVISKGQSSGVYHLPGIAPSILL